MAPSVPSGELSGVPSWEVYSQDLSPDLFPVCSWYPCCTPPDLLTWPRVTRVQGCQSPGQALVSHLQSENRPRLPAARGQACLRPLSQGQHSPHLTPTGLLEALPLPCPPANR